MSEFKSCPFCGGESLLRERYINGTANTKHYRRECHHCKATFAHWFRSIKKANEAWNRRAYEAEIATLKADLAAQTARADKAEQERDKAINALEYVTIKGENW